MKQGIKLTAILLSLVFVLGVAYAQQVCDDGSVANVTPQQLNGGSNRDPGSLTTTFAGGNGYAGNMFDILPAVDMYIDSIDVNVDALGETVEIDVYYKLDTCVGFESSPGDWTLLGNYKGIGAGAGNPTNIDMLGNGMVFAAGQTYGIYVDLVNYATVTGNMNYTNGSPTVYSNTDLTLTSHCGKGTPAFTGSTFLDRIWNGTINYNTIATGFTLSLDQLVGGQKTTFTMTGADPGDQLLLASSKTGGGPIYSPFGQILLTCPLCILTKVQADSTGTGTHTMYIPNAPGKDVWFQALNWTGRELSNGLAETIQ